MSNISRTSNRPYFEKHLKAAFCNTILMKLCGANDVVCGLNNALHANFSIRNAHRLRQAYHTILEKGLSNPQS